jgi:hypothetical protein
VKSADKGGRGPCWAVSVGLPFLIGGRLRRLRHAGVRQPRGGLRGLPVGAGDLGLDRTGLPDRHHHRPGQPRPCPTPAGRNGTGSSAPGAPSPITRCCWSWRWLADLGAATEVTVWCSNDYLGMGQHPNVIEAMHDALDRCGAGAGGTRNISGTNHYHVLLERSLPTCTARKRRCCSPRAMCRTGRRCRRWARASCPIACVLSDALNHASMIEGIRHSRAEKVIWKHNDPEDLDRKLASIAPTAEDRRLRKRLFDGWRHRADQAEIVEVCRESTAR